MSCKKIYKFHTILIENKDTIVIFPYKKIYVMEALNNSLLPSITIL
jgi:hypothetical protein